MKLIESKAQTIARLESDYLTADWAWESCLKMVTIAQSVPIAERSWDKHDMWTDLFMYYYNEKIYTAMQLQDIKCGQ